MTEKEYAQVIAKNLKRIAFERDKSQAQIAQELMIDAVVSVCLRPDMVSYYS